MTDLRMPTTLLSPVDREEFRFVAVDEPRDGCATVH